MYCRSSGSGSGRRLRRPRIGMGLITTIAAFFVLAVPALANSPVPTSSMVNSVTTNSATGAITVTVSGTWSWPTQTNCPTARNGVGYQIAWFDGNTANPIGQPNSPQGIIYVGDPIDDIVHSIDVLGGSTANGNAFYDGVPSSYLTHNTTNPLPTNTDARNWVSNCNNEDPTTKISSGTWGPISHTYPAGTKSIQFCPVMYDPHGHGTTSGGTIGSTSVGDITAGGHGANNDNSYTNAPNTQTNACPLTTVPLTGTIQAEIYQCVNGSPTATLVSGGNLSVPSLHLSSANPLAPTQAAPGSYTVDATAPSGMKFVACGQSGVTIPSAGSANQSVTVPAGGTGNGKFYVQAITFGYIEVCKSSANGVSGTFSFTVAGHTVSAPAGACSSAIQVPTGTEVVHELPTTGYVMSGGSVSPSERLVSTNVGGGDISATVVNGNVSTETIVTFVNKPVAGTVKICQVAGPGVSTGTNFSFTNSANSQTAAVPAGPSPGGYCTVLNGTFTGGQQVTITQAIPSGDTVSAIAVGPSNRVVGSPNLASGKVTILIGTGITEVTYTDQ